MASLDVEKLLQGLRDYFVTGEAKRLYEELTSGRFKISKIVTAVALLFEAVKAVEKAATDLQMMQSGGAKKEAVKQFIKDAISVPFYLKPLVGPIIGIVIDAVVFYYNTKIGHAWLGVITQFL